MRELGKFMTEERLNRWEKFCKTKAYKKARLKKARMRIWITNVTPMDKEGR